MLTYARATLCAYVWGTGYGTAQHSVTTFPYTLTQSQPNSISCLTEIRPKRLYRQKRLLMF